MLSQESNDSGVTLDPRRDPSFAKCFTSGEVVFYRRNYEGVSRHTTGCDGLEEGSIKYPTLYLIKVDDEGKRRLKNLPICIHLGRIMMMVLVLGVESGETHVWVKLNR